MLFQGVPSVVDNDIGLSNDFELARVEVTGKVYAGRFGQEYTGCY